MKVAIRSAQDLLEGLRAEDPALILAVQRTIRGAPEQALAFGTWEGRDVVDALVEAALGGRGMLALASASTLSVFEGERVQEAFLALLTTTLGPGLDAAVAWLFPRREALVRSQLYPALLQNDSLHRARCAARLLGAPAPQDPAPVALRVGLLTPGPGPAFDPELWLPELEGVAAPEARVAWRAHGRPAFDWLRAHFAQRPPEWLVLWGVEEWPRDCESWVAEWLTDPARASLGLASVKRAPQLLPALQAPLDALAATGSPKLRVRAVRAGGRLAWDPGLPAVVRAALLERWPEAPLEVLLDSARDSDWRVRAAAGETLARRGGRAVEEAARELLEAPEPEVRAGAVQVLCALGRQSWVEEALLEP